MNQKQRILSYKNIPVISVGNTIYKGQPPQFIGIKNELGDVTGHKKVSPGVPFIRVSKKKGEI